MLHWLVSAIVAGSLLQFALASPWLHREHGLAHLFALSISGLEAGRIWTLFTHSFLHSPRFVFHGIGNVVVLYFLGRELLPLLGVKRFVGLYGAATAIGGLAWLAVHAQVGGDGMLMGSTAAVYAFVVVFACFFPQQELRFWLFFVIPVTLKPRHIAYALAGFDLFGLLFFEIPGAAMPLGMTIANSAHLGGMATGLLYHRFFHEARWLTDPQQRAEIALPRPVRPARKPVTAPAPLPVSSGGNRAEIRAEVDRILDKINSHGFAALTREEKQVLDDAKDAISRR